MKYYKCFLCKGQPQFKVGDNKDPYNESYKHYMEHHYKEPTDNDSQKENRQGNRG